MKKQEAKIVIFNVYIHLLTYPEKDLRILICKLKTGEDKIHLTLHIRLFDLASPLVLILQTSVRKENSSCNSNTF